MTIREKILRSRAAEYIGTSMVAMTDVEYQSYLKELIDYNYPHFALWSTLFDTTPSRELVEKIQEILSPYITYENEATVNSYITALRKGLESLSNLYKQLTLVTSDDGSFDLYEWWLLTPTGPKSCSRDIGSLRTQMSAGRGDEWEWDIEIAVYNYQALNSTTIPIATGYACAETLRRLRLDT